MLKKYFSYDQLARAWQQINSGQNLTYKYYFKHIYHGYEHGLEHNLKILSYRLLSGGFKANQVLRFFIPKSISSQRPITQLPVEEQIAYQAIAAKVADEICAKRRKFEYKVVFSNILAEDRTIFMFENWQHTYGRFQEETNSRIKSGYHWVVTCDLASFYDTVSHEILFNNVPSLKRDTEARDYFSDILCAWTFEKKYEARRHGLPQGPIASDLLAEAFLLVMDENLSPELNYIRYVDDVRIFAKSQEEAQFGALKLERFLRGMGLVPQPEKFSILELKTGRELNKIETSQSYRFEEDPDEAKPKLSAIRTEKILRKALKPLNLGGKPLRTLTRFALFRGTPNNRTKKMALDLAKSHPEYVEAAFVFLRQHSDVKSVLKLASDFVEKSVFGFVRMKCWELFHFLYDKMPPLKKKQLAQIACKIIRTQDKQEATNIIGAAQYLFRHSIRQPNKYGRWPFYIDNSFILALALKKLEGVHQGVGEKEYKRFHSDLGDVGLAALHMHSLIGKDMLAAVNKSKRSNSCYMNSLKKLSGIGLPEGEDDPVKVGLKELLGVSIAMDTRTILGKKWSDVHNYIVRANVYKVRSPGIWLRSVNGICELFVRSMVSAHNAQTKRSKKRIFTKPKDGKSVKYGQLLSEKQPLAVLYPGTFDELRIINDRRNADSESHAINEKTGKRPKSVIKDRELTRLRKAAAVGLSKVDAHLIALHPTNISKNASK